MRIPLVLAFAVPIGLSAPALAQNQTLTLGGRAAVSFSKPATPSQPITYGSSD